MRVVCLTKDKDFVTRGKNLLMPFRTEFKVKFKSSTKSHDTRYRTFET